MRIYITGSSGAGKTTYARTLAKGLKIPLFSTDDFYNDSTKTMYTIDQINNVVSIDSDWIIEGAYYIPDYIRNADKVVYIKSSWISSLFRIWKRWLKDEDLRKKFGFFRTVLLSYTTVKDFFISDGVKLNTNIPKHYMEKDRYNLCKYNAKVFEVRMSRTR